MTIHAHEPPVVGSWYVDIEHELKFEVVAIDDEKAIEVQYFEGEVEEIDEPSWYGMRLIRIAAPEDWTGPYEVDKEQFPELKDEYAPPSPKTNPLNSIE